jgi:hypothetical protein
MLKGALHVHSTYSDGEFTLRELRRELSSDGFAFACLSDHAEWLNERRRDEYLAESRELSDESFTFVAGLEYECEQRLHIVGYGSTGLLSTTDPVDVIRQIEEAGAVAVIAHPKTALFPWIETFERLPAGIEVWNSKYDGRYAPRAETFALLDRLRARRSDLRAFYGQDLHWRHQYRGLQVVVDSASNNSAPDAILSALRSGGFVARIDNLELPSTGDVGADRLERFARLHRRSTRLRQAFAMAKRCADDLGVSVPDSLKGQVRRLF